MDKKGIKKIVMPGVIAAAYMCLTLLFAPISYAGVQFRVSEALCLLPFLYPESSYGLFCGCLLANLLNPAGINILDVVFGSLATLAAGIATSKIRRKAFAPLPMAIFNGIIVGAVLAFTYAPDNFLLMYAVFGAQVAAGELAVGYVIGLPLISALEKYTDIKNTNQ